MTRERTPLRMLVIIEPALSLHLLKWSVLGLRTYIFVCIINILKKKREIAHFLKKIHQLGRIFYNSTLSTREEDTEKKYIFKNAKFFLH